MAKDSWGKVKNWLGLEIEDEYDDDELYDDEYEYEEEELGEEVEEKPVYKSKTKKDKGIAMTTATSTSTGSSSKVLVVEPVQFSDAPVVCDNLKRDKIVVINLENAELEEGKKIFNFLNGAVYALDGTIQKISENVFVLAPKSVDVIAENIDSSMTKDILNWKFD